MCPFKILSLNYYFFLKKIPFTIIELNIKQYFSHLIQNVVDSNFKTRVGLVFLYIIYLLRNFYLYVVSDF